MYGWVLLMGIVVTVLTFNMGGMWGFVPLYFTGLWYLFGP